MSESQDTWNEIQAHKSKQLSLREKLAKRKRAREEVVAQVAEITAPTAAAPGPSGTQGSVAADTKAAIKQEIGECCRKV